MPDSPLAVPVAIDIFLASYAHLRCYTRPAEVAPLRAGMRVIRDVADGQKAPTRRQEIVAAPGSDPQTVIDVAKDYLPGGGYVLSVFASSDGAPVDPAFFKARGYRLSRTEPLMAIRPETVPTDTPRHVVKRATTADEAALLAKAAGSQILLPEHLEGQAEQAAVRAYYIESEGKIVARAQNVRRHTAGTYLSGLHTDVEFRRQGMATALLQAFLRDDAANGVEHNVLLATQTGTKLYTRFGYENIGSLTLFTPVRGK